MEEVESHKDEHLVGESSPWGGYPLEAAVMMANDSTIEDQLANLTKLLEAMNKRMQYQDAEIAKLA